MTGETPELPVKLACGHIIGSGCIMSWLNPLSSQGNNSCPECRAAIVKTWDKNDFRPLLVPGVVHEGDDTVLVGTETQHRMAMMLVHELVHALAADSDGHEDALNTVTYDTVQSPVEFVIETTFDGPVVALEDSSIEVARISRVIKAENTEPERCDSDSTRPYRCVW